MPVYASFLKLTSEGNKEISKSRERFELGKKNVERHGGKILSAFYIVSRGEYLILSEFPDENSRVKSMLTTLEHGTVSYEVFKALPVEEFFNIVEK
ncbi:MAG: GYD domain-containing protein [Syntrophobacteraceae bacterium]|nr:GYD domain-containing protein [Syntrophobacteraceae bacterium]